MPTQDFQAGLYANLSPDGTRVECERSMPSFSADSERWLPLVIDPQPAFNPVTQRRSPSYIIEAGQVRKTWAVVPLTAAELEDADAATQLTQIQAVLADLRNGTGTTAQRLQRVERVCAQLIKRLALKGILP